MAVEQVLRNAAGNTSTLQPGAVNNQSEYITAPNYLQWLKEGRIFTVRAGSLASAATFNSTSMTTLRPDLAIRAPAATVIIPLFAQAVVKAVGGALTEVTFRVCQNDVGSGTSTSATPVNNNTDSTKTSGTACSITYTGDCSALTNQNEVYRLGGIGTLTLVSGPLDQGAVYAPFSGRGMVCQVGGRSAGSFLVNVSTGTSSSGFVIATFAEFTAAEWYGS